MLVPKKTKPLSDKLVELPSSPVSLWKEVFPYLLVFADFFQAKKKLIKKRGNSLLPFKFSHAQWFLEHWTLVSAVVSSLPRWSIAVPPAVKPVPREGRVGQTLHDKRRCHSCSQKQQTKNKPRNAQLNLQQCRDAAEVIWHLCTSFSLSHLYSFHFPQRHLSQQGVVSVETTDSRLSPSEKLLLW